MLNTDENTVPINEQQIFDTLKNKVRKDEIYIREVLAKALDLKGLNEQEIASLSAVSDPDLLKEMFNTAKKVKEEIYGKRLVLFAPLYVSNLCKNECLYCAFRRSNKLVRRKALSQEEVRQEVEALVEQGHKRILLVAGESYPSEGFDYILKCIETIYSVKKGRGEIRRVNVNVAPLTLEEFKELKSAKIGTYQLFQETYHRETYGKVHIGGVKRDFDWRITAMDRAMEAGIDDVGVGILFGLFDWRFEILALMQHIRHLEKKFGVGPHTISVPRLEPAVGSELSAHPPYPVSDIDFRKIVAILRLAVPYTGIIMSTRETPNIRRETFALGVSQISAGSRTNPGGYTGREEEDMSQFSLGDHRSLDEVIYDISQLGYIPSFCTACYRLGRTGVDFMDLAKPGLIKNHCEINALTTFVEYLEDYASPPTKELGWKRIEEILSSMPEGRRNKTQKLIDRVKSGERDVFV
ncbi:MAG: [FeFe] hydrogenase H-cluster radical SAM maturase HydG [Candidatus Hydrogenedentes bacterium]|nr:[FeFe] hydrogenase H-cluster radical SAM maturase HydG [Candidatus Hydrogenedentota bacterium]